MQGNAPDLLFVNGLPFGLYGKRGLLENLYAWMDADDSCASTDFTQNLLKALESAEHKLYQMPQSYSIVTTAGLRDLAGSRSDWTYAAVNEELANSKTLLSAFYGETGESLAVTLFWRTKRATCSQAQGRLRKRRNESISACSCI